MKGSVVQARRSVCVAATVRAMARSLSVALGVLCACEPGVAHAQEAGVLTPGAKNIILAAVEPMEDWQDPAFGDSVALGYGCGHVLEARLLRTPRTNYADVVVFNSTQTASSVSREANVVFNSGRERRISERFGPKEELAPQRWQRLFFEFPSKEDFGEEASLRIAVALGVDGQQECQLVAELARPPGYRDDAKTTTKYEEMNAYGLGGGGVSLSGNMKTLGKPRFAAFGVAIYPWARHGFYAEAGFGSHDAPTLDPLRLTARGFAISRVDGSVGYASRYPLSSVLDFTYQAGLGLHGMALSEKGDPDAPTLESETQAFAMHRLGLDLGFYLGPEFGGVGLGVSVEHRYTAAGSIAGLPLDGHAVSLLFAVRGFQ